MNTERRQEYGIALAKVSAEQIRPLARNEIHHAARSVWPLTERDALIATTALTILAEINRHLLYRSSHESAHL